MPHQSSQPKVIIFCTECGKAVPSSQREMLHSPSEDSYSYKVTCHGTHGTLKIPQASKLEPSSTTVLEFPSGNTRAG